MFTLVQPSGRAVEGSGYTQDQIVAWARNFFAGSGFFQEGSGEVDLVFDLFLAGSTLHMYRWDQAFAQRRMLACRWPYELWLDQKHDEIQTEIDALVHRDKNPTVSHRLHCRPTFEDTLKAFDRGVRKFRTEEGLSPESEDDRPRTNYLKLILLILLTTN